MKRFLLMTMFACSLVLGTFTMTGCNTFAGMGKDVQETGDAVTGTPLRDAYHQDARDF